MNISIVIPVFNESVIVDKTIGLIKNNTFFKNIDNKCEIIIVDNGSIDDIKNICLKNKVTFIEENSSLNSPYSARNRGIELSTGEIIVLLDATCRPTEFWLENGIKFLLENDFDIVAGEVKFDFQNKYTSGKVYDSLTNIKMRESVEKKNIAKTANLFIKKEVFKTIGMFPEKIRSGGDVRWTKKATDKGLKLGFSEKAVVFKIARNFSELVIKQKRVALNQPYIWYEIDKKIILKRYLNIGMLLPARRKTLLMLIKKRGNNSMYTYVNKMIFIGWFIKIVMFIFNLKGLHNLKKDIKNENLVSI
jgi:glycosyltransferase involved in cell wall biosynthesis